MSKTTRYITETIKIKVSERGFSKYGYELNLSIEQQKQRP